VCDLLRDLNLGGQTLVLVTHDARLARSSASRMVSMRDGRLAESSVDSEVPA
jgi:putative ABC transport system ATP-binding protein